MSHAADSDPVGWHAHPVNTKQTHPLRNYLGNEISNSSNNACTEMECSSMFGIRYLPAIVRHDTGIETIILSLSVYDIASSELILIFCRGIFFFFSRFGSTELTILRMLVSIP